MKIKFLLLTTFIYLSLSAGTAKVSIVAAINSGDYEKLAEFFDSNVDMKILDKENIYSNAQAKLILKEFFSKYPPQKFFIFHEGGPENATFAIGNLTTAKGVFRIYFLLKKKGERLYIQKFRVEEDG